MPATETIPVKSLKRNGKVKGTPQGRAEGGNGAQSEIQEKIEFLTDLQKRYDSFVQKNPLPIVIIDRDYRVLEVNRAYEELMRRSREELLAMKAADYKVRHVSGDRTERTFSEKVPTRAELELSFRDGSTKIVEQYGVPLTIEGGEVKTAYFLFNDVTKQRESEREIAKQMERIRALQRRSETIVQQNPMPILLLDTSYKIVVTNEAFVKMSGIPRETLLSMSARDFRVVEQRGEGLKQVVQHRKRSYGEVVVELPSGVHVLEQYGIPILNEKEELINILIVYNDVTEKREKDLQLEKLMRETRERSDQLEKSARELEESLKLLAKGDLTKAVNISENDPLQRAKNDYNAAIDAIKSLLIEISQVIRQVETNIQDSSKGTNEVAKAAEGVAFAAQNCSENTRKLLDQIDEINRQMSDLNGSIRQVSGTSQEITDRAQKVAKEGSSARELGIQVNQKMQAVEKIAQQSVDEISRLTEQMREISNVVRLITDIANQTNLLALNAAIEAARAGEHGRGFAVVAGEVRNLAGEAKSATNHIEEVIGAITKTSEKTAVSIRNSYVEIQAGIEAVNRAIEALNKIIQETDEVARGITGISRSTEMQAGATANVLQRVEKVVDLTKETQKQVEDMAALAEETSASTEEVASATHEVSEMAHRLENMVNQFRLN